MDKEVFVMMMSDGKIFIYSRTVNQKGILQGKNTNLENVCFVLRNADIVSATPGIKIFCHQNKGIQGLDGGHLEVKMEDEDLWMGENKTNIA